MVMWISRKDQPRPQAWGALQAGAQQCLRTSPPACLVLKAEAGGTTATRPKQGPKLATGFRKPAAPGGGAEGIVEGEEQKINKG